MIYFYTLSFLYIKFLKIFWWSSSMIRRIKKRDSVKWFMKKLSPKIRLKRTLKIVDIDNNKLSEGLGRCPKYPQGTRPLTQIRALPEPILAGRQEKGAVAPFSAEIG